MSDETPDNDTVDDIDAQYRHAAALDPGRPAESVRRNILTHAAAVAAQRSGDTRAVNQLRWRPKLIGTLAAAALAGLLVTPHLLPPRITVVTERPVSGTRGPVSPATTLSEVQPSPAKAPPLATNAAARAPAVARPEVKSAADFAADSVRSTTALNKAAPLAGAARSVEPEAALRLAAGNGDVAQLQALLASGVDVNARDDQGRTALMLATMRGQAQAATALLAQGADPNAADANGTTPLQAARASGQTDVEAALQRAAARRATSPQ